MASSQPRGGERMIHQDFIARIRYSNALPPAPIPPKLLDIPNTGLSSGQYTTPGFASRLAREQPLNIEADAELGMPLDLVGMPGIFDGDESSIQAPAQPPQIHPRDRPLLRPLSTLGKPVGSDASVSFLRRTEYISSSQSRFRAGDPFLRPQSGNRAPRRPEKRKSPEPDEDSPAMLKRKIQKEFEVAEQQLKDPSRVKHPSKPNVHVVDAFPMLPDLEAFPDSGAYVTVKFIHSPLPNSQHYDTRLLSGLFKPIERTEAEEQAFDAAMEAYERDPARNPKPNNMMNYEYFLADSASTADRFRRRFDVDNPDRDDDALYTSSHGGGGPPSCFQFNRLRAYETAQETELDHESKYSDEIILAFTDDGARPKAAYYYPVMQRTTVRPQRTKNIARTIGIQSDQDQIVDQIDVTVDDPSSELRGHMLRYQENPLGFADDDEDDDDEDEPGPSASRDKNGGGATPRSPAPNGSGSRGERARGSQGDQDEDGEEEDDAEGEEED